MGYYKIDPAHHDAMEFRKIVTDFFDSTFAFFVVYVTRALEEQQMNSFILSWVWLLYVLEKMALI